MADETMSPENDLVALEIGRAILNAQTMADRIVADAHRRADEISQTVAHAPAESVPRSRVALIARDEAIAMLQELDSAERELQDCQAELMALLDRCLESPADSSPSRVRFEEPDANSSIPGPPAAATASDVVIDDEVVADPALDEIVGPTEDIGDGLETPFEAKPEQVQSADPSPHSDEAFWHPSAKQAWNSVELEGFRQPATRALFQPDDQILDSADTIEARSDEFVPRSTPESLGGSPTDEAVPETKIDFPRELQHEVPSTQGWAPPSGSPVAVPETVYPTPSTAEGETVQTTFSDEIRMPDQGVFRRLASLPNMLALAGTLVVLLVLLIIVQTV